MIKLGTLLHWKRIQNKKVFFFKKIAGLCSDV